MGFLYRIFGNFELLNANLLVLNLPLVTRAPVAFGLFGGEPFGLPGVASTAGVSATVAFFGAAFFFGEAFFFGDADFLAGRGTILDSLKLSNENKRKSKLGE